MIIAGCDEVGRGAFAGPVVAACVVLASYSKNLNSRQKIYINDSKKLTPKQRRIASDWIKENALAWGIGEVSAKIIDKMGLTKAANIAFRRAIKSAQERGGIKIEKLVIDAFYIPHIKGIPQKNQFAIIKADSKSQAVAAASIIAKVHRDNLMTELSQRDIYKKYKWNENKGYGTKDHRNAIQQFGLTTHHRKLFLRKLGKIN